MADDVIRRIATETATLPNKEAWALLEGMLAANGVPRRDWSKARTAIWAERTRQKRQASNVCHCA
ncbi:MAG TPA: hypothetical protein VMB73_25520 [Acetobacteraceae bacterium]|nr:hypothetical protein [Acetobacteraceae bacterium]